MRTRAAVHLARGCPDDWASCQHLEVWALSPCCSCRDHRLRRLSALFLGHPEADIASQQQAMWSLTYQSHHSTKTHSAVHELQRCYSRSAC